MSDLTDIVEPEYISADLLRILSGRKRIPHTPSIRIAFESAFDLIGGVPRLALWADRNPSQFYALYSKLLPATNVIAPASVSDLEALPITRLKQLVLQHCGQQTSSLN